jgi:hypothetical protein
MFSLKISERIPILNDSPTGFGFDCEFACQLLPSALVSAIVLIMKGTLIPSGVSINIAKLMEEPVTSQYAKSTGSRFDGRRRPASGISRSFFGSIPFFHLDVMFIFIRWFICDLLVRERHIWRARPFPELEEKFEFKSR